MACGKQNGVGKNKKRRDMKPITTRKEGLIDHIRTIITQGYSLLQSNPDFTLIKSVTVNALVIPDDFLKLTKELTELKWQLRESLNKLSAVVEEMDGAINEIKLVIERENMKKKKGETKHEDLSKL
jgi:cell division protein ZapA (FtsZ GTPase activity inhibitor)